MWSNRIVRIFGLQLFNITWMSVFHSILMSIFLFIVFHYCLHFLMWCLHFGLETHFKTNEQYGKTCRSSTFLSTCVSILLFSWLQVHLHTVPDEWQLPGPGPAVRHPPECNTRQYHCSGQHRGVRLSDWVTLTEKRSSTTVLNDHQIKDFKASSSC